MATDEKPKSTPQTQTVHTVQGDIKITQSNVHGKKSHINVLLEPDDLVRDQVGGFISFLREHAVVGLAVGFIIGQQANAVVKQLVASFIDPLFSLLFGKSLSGRTLTLHHQQAPVVFPWGAFVYILLDFFFVILAVYAVIKIFNLDKLDKKKDE